MLALRRDEWWREGFGADTQKVTDACTTPWLLATCFDICFF